MAGTILTPTAIWKNFIVNKDFSKESVSSKDFGTVTAESFYIDGRKMQDGVVKIFCELTKNTHVKKGPAILLLQDFESAIDYQLISDLVKRGYAVLSVDLAGYKEHKENFTVYPDTIEHANYERSKDALTDVEKDAISTCWYEWTAVARNALAYLRAQDFVDKIGGLGIGKAGTVMWQVAGTDKNLDSAVFAFNAGWAGYRGIRKFSNQKEPQFSDNMYKFIAGIDSQSYAMHVSCPTMVLCATNSDEYDLDRAFDTLSHVKSNQNQAIYYSVGSINEINGEGYKNTYLFFEKTLVQSEEQAKFPSDIQISGEVLGGKIHFEVTPDQTGLKDISLYVSEQEINPCTRSWQKLDFTNSKQNKFIFEYNPYASSKIVTAFAVAVYQDGFTIGSNVIAVKFEEKEVNGVFKSNVIYSSRQPHAESHYFSMKEQGSIGGISLNERHDVSIKRGPMGIYGVTGKNGIATFKVACEKYKFAEGAMIMFDVYAKEKSTLTVKLVCDYFGDRREYMACVNLLGGGVWHNVQLEMNKFKTEEGMPLKSYEKVQALCFNVEYSEFLINNVLWV